MKDVAQNILSFMKANCTREGHTYWLFKGIVVFNFASVNPLHHITHFGENGQVLLLAYLFLNMRRLRCNESVDQEVRDCFSHSVVTSHADLHRK